MGSSTGPPSPSPRASSAALTPPYSGVWRINNPFGNLAVNYWERTFPHTPTIHALREDRYKFIRCYGIWDIDELYDLEEDPAEMNNLIFSPQHRSLAQRMRGKLFSILEGTGGMQIPLFPDVPFQANLRDPNRSHAADFPDEFYRRMRPVGPPK